MKSKYLINTFIVLFFSVLLTSCQVWRFIFYNFADIKDYKIFPYRSLHKDSTPFKFYTTTNGKYPTKINTQTKHHQKTEVSFDTFLEKTNTVAFLIIKNDTIQYEKYFHHYNEKSIVPSFSMAKSIISILIGCAIDDKLIQSVNDPVTKYIPELKKNNFDKVTIKHLLQMTSGIKFKENYYNPFGDAATYYYGTNLRKKLLKMKLKQEPGKKFEYISGNTQLLGLILERVLQGKTITQYLQEKIWTPLGMEYDASWSIDKRKNGLEKTFCCINARARDFAKIGRLYLNKGMWNGKQIVSKEWVETSTKQDTTDGSVSYYKYHWWLPSSQGDFLAEGFLGQYIYVNPNKKLIIVRLGKNSGKAKWWSIFLSLAKYY